MLLLSFSVVSSKETNSILSPGPAACRVPTLRPMWHVPTWVLEKAHFPLEDRAWRKSMPVCADSRHTSRHPGPIMPNTGPGAPGVSEQPQVGCRHCWEERMLHATLQSHRTLRLFQKAAKVCSTHPVWQQVSRTVPQLGLPAGDRVGSGLNLTRALATLSPQRSPLRIPVSSLQL